MKKNRLIACKLFNMDRITSKRYFGLRIMIKKMNLLKSIGKTERLPCFRICGCEIIVLAICVETLKQQRSCFNWPKLMLT